MSHAEPQFSTARKGYKPEEVEAFVATINGTIDDLNAQLGAMQRDLTDAYEEAAELREQAHTAGEELEKANQELGIAREQEEALRMTLVSASRTKDEMLARAQLESENMVADATAEAETILAAARDEAAGVDTATRQARTELEQRTANVESDLRNRAEAFETQLAAAHGDGLTSIARLDALYQETSQQLTTLLETAQREITAGRRELADFDPSAAVVDQAPPRVDETPAPPAQPVESQPHQSALDKVASLTHSPQLVQFESPPEPEPISAAPKGSPTPVATQPRPATAEPARPAPNAADLPSDAGLLDESDPIDDDPDATPDTTEAAEEEHSVEERREPSDHEVPDEAMEQAGEGKPSFYNRRSGQLPRLGDDKQRDTTSSMASLRDKI